MNSKNLKYFFCISIFSFILAVNTYAQNDTAGNDTAGNDSNTAKDTVLSGDSVKTDTTKFSTTIDLLRKLGEQGITKMINETNEKNIHSRQLDLLHKLEGEFNKVNEIFKRGIDTTSINLDIKKTEEQFKIASEGIFTGEIRLQTMRNLNTSSLLIVELSTRLENNKKKIERYLDQLVPLKNTLDSMQTDSLLFWFSTDSVLFMDYFNELVNASPKLGPIDSNLTSSIKNLNFIVSEINNLSGKISTSLELIEGYKKQLSGSMYSDEFTGSNDPDMDTVSFKSKFEFSKTKANLLLNYYLSNNFWKLFLLISSIIILIYFTYNVRYRYNSNLTEKSVFADLVFNHPILSPVFICLSLVQFIFPHPPVFFSGMLWIFSSVILTVILWNYFSGLQRVYWLYFVTSFIAVLLIDLQLKESGLERWIMMFISLVSIIVVVIILRKNILENENRKAKFYFLIFSLILLSGTIIANLTGRYNLSKIYLTLCFFGILTAYLLYWAWILFTNLLNVSVEAYKFEGNQNFKDKVLKLKNSIPVYLKFFLIGGWIIIVFRNFYFYERISGEITQMVEKETLIGDFTFSLEKLILFFFIILISAIISKLISLFSDRFDNSENDKEGSISKAGGLSNWMLLIRIAVISIGTLFAFAATGIPIDKMTIIIGSLGVGIGLGLQSIVNNLVSGIILAFEKPFKIGDFIDVSGESGKIKEIGIRSSKISTMDGADIIIPNGDLLSKHVINWTLRNSLKRSELNLKIKYGSHLNDIISIFNNVMENNDQIEKYPKPEVLLHQFGSGSAEYKLLYWTHMEYADSVKSKLILSIDEELRKAGIDLDA